MFAKDDIEELIFFVNVFGYCVVEVWCGVVLVMKGRYGLHVFMKLDITGSHRVRILTEYCSKSI